MKIFAATVPHVCSSTVEAKYGEDLILSGGQQPSTPSWNRKYSAMMPRIAEMIDRGSVRPGSRSSPPR